MPKVSVIIPVYNVEKYLRQCLDSVVNQTLTDIEIICVDDCSTDNSLSILKEYAEKDSRIKIIEQKENQGQGVARNDALKVATGEYVGFVDSDDWIELNAFQTLYDYAKANDAQVVHFNFVEYNEHSGKYKKNAFAESFKKKFHYDLLTYKKYSKDIVKKELFTFIGYVCNRISKREFLAENRIRFATTKTLEDIFFAIGVILSAKDIYFLDEYLYYYRIRQNSTINSRDGKNEEYAYENIKQLKSYLEEYHLFDKYQQEYRDYCVIAFALIYRQIPIEKLEDYKAKCKSFLTSKEYKKFCKIIKGNKSIFQQIFSIKSKKENGIKTKIVTVLGLEFEIKNKNYKKY